MLPTFLLTPLLLIVTYGKPTDLDSVTRLSNVVTHIWHNPKCLGLKKQLQTDQRIHREHFQTTLISSAPFRNVRMATWAGYSGPWIENYWIDASLKLSPDAFYPWIPLLIQWNDLTYKRGLSDKNPHYVAIKKWMHANLRPDVLYVTVSQNDAGLGRELHAKYPNILSLSAGGYGHGIIPNFIGQPLPVLPPPLPNAANSVLFAGTASSGAPRIRIMNKLSTIPWMRKHIRFYRGPGWIHQVNASWFILAPRGYGRSTWKLMESLQLGRVPVVIYDDIPWLPYTNEVRWSKFAFVVSNERTTELPGLLSAINHTQYLIMRDNMLSLRHSHFIPEGTIKKVFSFIRAPHASAISCRSLPHSELSQYLSRPKTRRRTRRRKTPQNNRLRHKRSIHTKNNSGRGANALGNTNILRVNRENWTARLGPSSGPGIQ